MQQAKSLGLNIFSLWRGRQRVSCMCACASGESGAGVSGNSPCVAHYPLSVRDRATCRECRYERPVTMRRQQVHQQVHQTRTEHHYEQRVESSGTVRPPADASPPIFQQIFKNARFAQGGNAKFSGKLRGNPTPAVAWTRKGAPLAECAKYGMSYDPATGDVELLIRHIGPGDEGEYTCTARNQYGEAICSVYIQPEGEAHLLERSLLTTRDQFKVDTFEYRLLREVSFRESITEHRYHSETEITEGPPAPPVIAQKPRNSKLSEGDDAQFLVQLAGNPQPRVTWFKDGRRIDQSAKYEMTTTRQSSALRVRRAAREDSGHYTLLAENGHGCMVASAYLAVEAADTQQEIADSQRIEERSDHTDKALSPQFVRVCRDREVTEGKLTRFDCRVTGRPYPEVTWYINGREVRDDHRHKILVNESGEHALMLTDVNRAEDGEVTAVARNTAGEARSRCRLRVLEREQVVAPKFVERFSTLSVREGEPVRLCARAVASPTPQLTWQKDGAPLAPSAERRIHSEGGASTLDIPSARVSDAAWYQCTAQNVAGSTATRARLYVEVPQQPPHQQKRLHFPRPTKVIEPEVAPGPEIIYLRHVERARPFVPPGEEDRVYPPPQFILPLQTVTQIEGAKVHFETRIEPVGDPTMKIEWLRNGRSIEASK